MNFLKNSEMISETLGVSETKSEESADVYDDCEITAKETADDVKYLIDNLNITEDNIDKLQSDPNITVDCITEFEELPEEMLKLLKASVSIETDKEAEERIVKFIMQENNIADDEFEGLPQEFRTYVLKANKDKFNVLLKNSNLHDDVDVWA
jgi:hypothetical protein